MSLIEGRTARLGVVLFAWCQILIILLVANFWLAGCFRKDDVRSHGIHQSINRSKKFDLL